MNKQTTVAIQTPAVNESTCKCPYRPEASEPSLFTHVSGQVSEHWVKWFMDKFGLTQQMAANIGIALHDHLLNEQRRPLDATVQEPQAMLKESSLVSMAFVMHYKHTHNVDFTQAYMVGHDLVALQLNALGFSYSVDAPEPVLDQAFSQSA